MILRKPYAFFIKNFKFFHLILFILSSVLLYRTSLVYSFIKEFAKTTPNVIGKDLTSTLFVPWLYILVIIIIIVNIVIIFVLIKKDKPYIYYIFNITLYIGVLITNIASHRVIGNMETMLVATKTTLAIRDINNLARMLQTVSVVFYLIRATGFDIKKFDFVRDLHGLNISEEDSEEIEVAVEFEKNEIVRDFRSKIRHGIYYYKENKLILNLIFAIIISLILSIVYFSLNKYNRTYKEKSFFNVGTFSVGVKESYILTKDYKNETITPEDQVLVALKISARSNIEDKLQTSRTVLTVDGKDYYHIKDYKEKLSDLGKVYYDEIIKQDFSDYILVYQIPKESAKSNFIFKYIDSIEYKRGKTLTNSIDVKLSPKNIDDKEEKIEKYELGNQIDTTSSQISDYKIQINNYDIKERFDNNYNACIRSKECYDFKEILVPSQTRNNKKTLLKVDGTIEYQNVLSNITNLYEFIEKFGTIEYTLNNIKYKETGDFFEVLQTINKQENTYYIEIDKEIEQASQIKLVFNLRNTRYEYTLRGDANA